MTYELPMGWELHVDGYGKGYDVLYMPHRVFFATIDWKRRSFRLGMVVTGALTTRKKFTGRSWRQNLVNEAVAVLSGLLP